MHISSQLWIFKYFYPHLRKINWNSWNFTFISSSLWKQREDGLCMSRGLCAHLDSNFSSVFLICFFCCFAFLPNIILSSRFSFPQYFIIIIFVYICILLFVHMCVEADGRNRAGGTGRVVWMLGDAVLQFPNIYFFRSLGIWDRFVF